MRRLAGSLIILLVAAGLAGCGGGGGDELGDVELIRTAATTTEAAGSARMAMTVGVGGQELTAEGEFDFDDQRGRLSMDMSGVLSDLPDAPDDLTFDTVYDGTTIYYSSDLFGGTVDADWIRVDLSDLTAAAGIDPSQLPTSNNPTDVLTGLEAASEDGVEEVGQEEVRGTETTHYRATIDLASTFEENDAITDRDRFEAVLAQIGDDPVQTDVWLDDEGRVRRQSSSFGTGNAQVDLTMEMYDFGADVDVALPDEADTVDFGDLFGVLGD